MSEPQASPPTTPTIWPGAGRGIKHGDLPKHLFTVAAKHARRALAAAEDPLDLLDRANSIGTSVELLAKSALAHISPTLIAEKDPKSALLLSGVAVAAAYEAKTKSVTDCLLVLKNMGVDFNQQMDVKVLSVRNFALHLGQVDRTLFDEALGTMARLCEEILTVITQHDSTLDRSAFWGSDLLTHVDERLKEEQEAKTLRLQELLAAARRAFERLEQLGLDERALEQLAERDPQIDDENVISVLDWSPERRECPACEHSGWLGYQVIDRSGVYVETDGMCDAYHLVEVSVEARQFVCAVCGLDLDSELLSLVGLGDAQQVTDQASDEEIEAREQYDVERYLDEY
ncbi:hypothetical protein [Mycolicibacterium nivoides]|uniref:Uncharacterized protein n=1 Tax=Mycolicibacterium nivoides TaxID=2487344 RepID=A0ABW9LHD6_9MYCO